MKFEDQIQALQEKTKKLQGFSEVAEILDKLDNSVEAIERERSEAFLLPYSSPSMLPVRQWKLTNNA